MTNHRKIRLRFTSRRSMCRDAELVYTARYRGQSIGVIYRNGALWFVWQDNHGHDAKGSYTRRGDAKRALLRAVVEFRTLYPQVYGAP